MAASPHTLLATYLNDHYAGSTVGVELSRRARGSNEGTALGDLLARLAGEIEEDRRVLESVMDAVGAGRDPIKPRLAWLGEKAGRLKPNGQLRGYSPLSRLVELEGLELGIAGKQALWQALGELADPRLAAFDFAALGERAERQRAELEPHRLAAGREGFGG
jgi:hypothetical protein